ncbi:MAG: thiamine phosphate synthase [Eubacteriales bacterium]|nr:thiamine phosphate synthase [Eubacteriales bacterium]
MRMDPEKLRLYAVTDRSWLKPGESLGGVVEELLQGGVTCVQLREKRMGDRELLSCAEELLEVCRRYGVPLIINDRPDIAKRVGADGVHVGLADMEIRRARELLGDGYYIGSSAHSVQEALAAEAAGADYLGCGAVFGSATKTDASKLSLEELRRIAQAVRIPAVAIGGVGPDNIGRLRETGVSGAAVISALFAAGDKKKAAETLWNLWGGTT